MARILNEPSFSRNALTLIASGLFLLILAASVSLAQAAPLDQVASSGEQIFKAKCAACHTIGGGRLVGPDLKGVTARRDAAWLLAWIKAPDKLLAAGDPTATKLQTQYGIPMPNLGLSDADVADLIAYFQSTDGKSAPGPTQAASSSTGAASTQSTQPASQSLTGTALVLAMQGDPNYGEQLFTGAVPLTNRGTPCIACHTVLDTGLIGGGALGPDQTHVYARYGREGLAGVLSTLPFPTMRGVFANKPLTTDEQADLLAFFAKADGHGQPRTQSNFQTALGAGIGMAAILFIGLFLFWPRQRLSLAQRLRKNGKL